MLTSSPDITFFKTFYRRHTAFAKESMLQTLNGSVGFGNKVSVTISRNGDLLSDVWCEITLKKSSATFYPAEALISDVSLEIGGQQIDKHYADWFRVYNALFTGGDEKLAYKALTDFATDAPTSEVKRFYFPLRFFFCGNPGLALPLIALSYHEVKMYFTLASAPTGVSSSNSDLTFNVWADYIFLDATERMRFAQQTHDYLIDQVQFTGSETASVSASSATTQNIRLNFNHPVKYLAWVYKHPSYHGCYTAVPPTDYANTETFREGTAPMYSAKLLLNGQERFAVRMGSYFNKVQPFQATDKGYVPAGVYMYSFALHPNKHQPSGTCNFSRIDAATLALVNKTASVVNDDLPNLISESTTYARATALTQLNIYAVNVNVLRIRNGMGGLVYSS
jgi:hypothetical protein